MKIIMSEKTENKIYYHIRCFDSRCMHTYEAFYLTKPNYCEKCGSKNLLVYEHGKKMDYVLMGNSIYSAKTCCCELECKEAGCAFPDCSVSCEVFYVQPFLYTRICELQKDGMTIGIL